MIEVQTGVEGFGTGIEGMDLKFFNAVRFFVAVQVSFKIFSEYLFDFSCNFQSQALALIFLRESFGFC